MSDLAELATAETLKALAGVLPKKGRVLLIPHDYPDPDALAAAAALQLLLRRNWGLRGQIAFNGAVSRPENREMLSRFRYTWRFLNQVRSTKRVPAIFVDTAPWAGNVHVPDCVRPVAIFDHHEGRRTRAAPAGMFASVFPGVGATTTILFNYLRISEIAIPTWLATVMVYAIATETLDLSVATPAADLQAYMALLGQCNFRMLGEIRHAPLPREYYGLLHEAMANARTYGRVAWSRLARVERPEIVPEMADLLLRMERITWSFCSSVMDTRLIISLRSSRRNARCDHVLRRVIGRGGAAGGHGRMAAGYVELGCSKPAERDARRAELEQRLLARIEGRKEIGSAQPLTGQRG